jgi:hypothetical protein
MTTSPFDDAWETRLRDAAYTAVGLGVIAFRLAETRLQQCDAEATVRRVGEDLRRTVDGLLK